MKTDNNIAFKEWAVVCAALETGRQTIILRKGGMDEGREGFRVKHDEFWLLPTRFHQTTAALTPDAEPFLQQMEQLRPPVGEFHLQLYAVVHKVFELSDIAVVKRLAAEHILSTETTEQRFHYRHPGLFVLLVRTYRVPTPYEVGDSPYIAGCKSWVELPEALSTAGAMPMHGDENFTARSNSVLALIHP